MNTQEINTKYPKMYFYNLLILSTNWSEITFIIVYSTKWIKNCYLSEMNKKLLFYMKWMKNYFKFRSKISSIVAQTKWMTGCLITTLVKTESWFTSSESWIYVIYKNGEIVYHMLWVIHLLLITWFF